MKALLGTKLGMTQIIGDDGVVTPVTLLSAGPCTVTQIKTIESDGYNAVQIGYGEAKRLSKAVAGHVKKSKIAPKFIREINDIKNPEEVAVGDSFDVEVFEVGEEVDVVSTSKGKGFAGTIKRWNFHRGPKSHGGKGNIRRPGSIGSMYPQKVMKGKKMAGRMGAKRVTVADLKVAIVDKENGVLGVKGAVPGPKKSLVIIRGDDK